MSVISEPSSLEDIDGTAYSTCHRLTIVSSLTEAIYGNVGWVTIAVTDLE